MGPEEYTLFFFGFFRSKSPEKLLDFHPVIYVVHLCGIFFPVLLFCKSDLFQESKAYVFNILFAFSNRYGYVLSGSFFLFIIFKRRLTIVHALEQLNAISVDLKAYHVKKPGCKYVLFFHFMHGLASWVYPCYCLFSNYTNYSSCVYTGIVVDYQIFMITNFLTVLTVKIKCLFVKLRENIRCSQWDRKDRSAEIRSLLSLYGTLCELVNNVNECFSEVNLVVTTLEFVIIVDTIQYMFVGLFFFDCLFWCLKYAINFFMRIYFCSLLCEEAAKTGTCLQELLMDSNDPQVKEEVEIFSLQLLHRKIQFDACGFFKIDFRLLNSMIGAVTTYVVILIQFQTTGVNSHVSTNTSKTN